MDEAVLSWKIIRSSKECGLIQLDGEQVPLEGSLTVAPTKTTTYGLSISRLGMSRLLGSHTITVDTSACITVLIPESLVRTIIQEKLDALLEESDYLYEREPLTLEIDDTGVTLKFRLAIDIAGIDDPKLDINCQVTLEMEDGKVIIAFNSISIEIRPGGFPTGVPATDATINTDIEKVKYEAPNQLSEYANNLPVSNLLPNLKIHTISTSEDLITVTLCPTP
ncbi:hypothetical protein [Streptosporangium sandarakinum]|uniref:hypothetical protein n=1 Tax=Streptosporangium sandarakinum TaxID=1260955 RepID=UPI003445344A